MHQLGTQLAPGILAFPLYNVVGDFNGVATVIPRESRTFFFLVSIMENETVISLAKSLLNELLASFHDKYHVGTVVNGAYDTAWVSMVRKRADDASPPNWLFPECFEFLLSQQSENGGWGSASSPIMEQITCSLVSVLAIKVHLRYSQGLSQDIILDLESRIPKAVDCVRSLLGQNTDFNEASSLMAFELWFPVIIDELEKENLTFDIPGIQPIRELRSQKTISVSSQQFISKGTVQTHAIVHLGGHG